MEHLWTHISTFSLIVVGVLLIIIILLQRGSGGGLAGAFGGLGGQSAFGTKAGDVFTKITIVLAVIWVALAGLSGFAMRSEDSHPFKGGSEPASVEPTEPKEEKNEFNPFNGSDTDSDVKGKLEKDPADPSDQDKTNTNEQSTSGNSKPKDKLNSSSDTEAEKAGDKKQ